MTLPSLSSPDAPGTRGPRLSVALRGLRTGLAAGVGPPRAVRELQRFVPAPLRERIERGEELDLGERHVSILVGDLGGTTTFSARHRPREVFALLGRLAELFSEAVEAHGGEICELQGSTILAAFGASRELPAMERAAVHAVETIWEGARALEGGEGPAPGLRLTPVFGLATGEAYVGAIRVGDRTWWSAVGDPTRRAVRLHRLARDRGAILAVDPRTHARGADLSGSGRARFLEVASARGTPEAYLLPGPPR